MVSDFDKLYNISYIKENDPPSNRLIIRHCICSYIIYFIIYLLLTLNPFFKRYIDESMANCYVIFYILYVIFAPILFFIFRPKTLYKSHNVEICNYFVRIFKQIFNKNTILTCDYMSILKGFIPSYEEKQALMLMFIKVFFGAQMFSFLWNDSLVIKKYIVQFSSVISRLSAGVVFKSWILKNGAFLYFFALKILTLIDLIPFVIGYLTELSILNNKIRTVDTNIVGIIFCLMCYAPFGHSTIDFLGWNQSDNPNITGDFSLINSVFLLIGLFFMAIYSWASVTLGFKASNLTNRGIVTKFPYNIVRHPAYICKNIFWFCTTIQLLFVDFHSPDFNLKSYLLRSGLIILAFLFWALIYYFRAVTEERHLMQDPDYQEYCKKVHWRFIPYVI